MPLDDPLAILALIGITAFSVTSYFNYQIYTRLKTNGKTTVEYLFLRGEIKTALEILIVSILIFLTSSLITIIAVKTQMIILAQAIRAGTAIMFIAYTAFFTILAIYTKPESTKKFRNN